MSPKHSKLQDESEEKRGCRTEAVVCLRISAAEGVVTVLPSTVCRTTLCCCGYSVSRVTPLLSRILSSALLSLTNSTSAMDSKDSVDTRTGPSLSQTHSLFRSGGRTRSFGTWWLLTFLLPRAFFVVPELRLPVVFLVLVIPCVGLMRGRSSARGSNLGELNPPTGF